MNEINGLIGLATPNFNQLNGIQTSNLQRPYNFANDLFASPNTVNVNTNFTSGLQQGVNSILAGLGQLFAAVLGMVGSTNLQQSNATGINNLQKTQSSTASNSTVATTKPGNNNDSGILASLGDFAKGLPGYLMTALGTFGALSSVIDYGSGWIGKLGKIFK